MDDRSLSRFMRHVKVSDDGCWLWRGGTAQGYGIFRLGDKAARAHRVSYEHFVGPITEAQLDHVCRRRECVNPEHLEPVSHAENSRRKPKAQYCKRGHSLADAPVWNGARHCRTCSLDRKRAYKARQRERRNGGEAAIELVARKEYTLTLHVVGQSTVSIAADSPDEAIAKAERIQAWDLDVDITSVTVDSWEIEK